MNHYVQNLKFRSVTFPDLNVLEFQFAAIQLNRLSWRDFLQQKNPFFGGINGENEYPHKRSPAS
jgi:hypothetical protein